MTAATSSIAMTATTAPLTNVALCMSTLERAMNRSHHLPGMVAFYGPSGYGKTFSASYTANQQQAYYIECKSSWTKKALLLAIAKEMSLVPANTLYHLTDQIAEQLVLSQRPLIVDEMDHMVDKKAVEIIRDIYEASQAPILLIGEERMPNKLKRWERFHGRILDFVPAQPASFDDADHLRTLYGRGVEIADDMLTEIHRISRGSVRRICVNIDRVREVAAVEGWDIVDLKKWGQRELFTGEAPARRVA